MGDSTAPFNLAVALTFETWGDTVRREFTRPPDRFIRHVWDHPDVAELAIVNPWRSFASVARRRFGPRSDATFPTDGTHRLVRPVRVRRDDPVGVAELRRGYEVLTRKKMSGAFAAGRASHLVTYNPFVAAFSTGLTGFESITYVARDDFASAKIFEPYWPSVREAYRVIRERRIAVSAVSAVLLDRIAPRGPAIVVPNGLDPDRWLAVSSAMPIESKAPVILYSGNIDDRVSIDRISSIVARLPDCKMLFVGAVFRDMQAQITRVCPTAIFTGEVKQGRLAELTASADLCVMPHVDSDLTRSMSPLKIYEYVAAGRRVVATDLPPARSIDPSVVLVAKGEDFGDTVLRALQLPPLTWQHRREFAAANSWQQRCARLLDFARWQGEA